MHRFYLDDHLPDPGQTVILTGEEAAHALRVKRLAVGEAVEVRDGRGGIAAGLIAEAHPARNTARVVVRVDRVERVPPHSPAVHICAATPKGGRVDEMIDGLAQVGAASWRPLLASRSVVDPREHKLERLERIAAEAAKQCGRAWLLEIGGKIRFEEALRPEPGSLVVVADASGEPFHPGDPRPAAVRLLVGPEGGWTPAELAAARETPGVRVARFGVHTMRIETAALVATGILMDRLGPA